MKDHFGRAIDYMRVSITDRCNLRCKYCMPDGIAQVSMSDILTYEEIKLICQAAAETGIKKFKITGGEPLVRLGCTDLFGELKKIPGVEQVTMTTNGVLLGEYLPELMENGLDAVNISLDTLKEGVYQEITGHDELAKVLENIEKAIDAGLRVKVNSVLQKGRNDAEWRDLAELTIKKPLDVRFIEMMPIGLGKEYEPVYNEELLGKLKALYPAITEDNSVHGNGPAVYYRIPGAKGSIGFISAMHGKFCRGCNRIRLTSQGKIKPCLCFGEDIDLREILRGEAEAGVSGQPEKIKVRLREAISRAIGMKPEGHRFEEENEITEQKKMVQIGG